LALFLRHTRQKREKGKEPDCEKLNEDVEKSFSDLETKEMAF
jgi:hypothetical protein